MLASLFARRETLGAMLGTTVALAACGSRGPLDIEVVQPASDGGDASVIEASIDANPSDASAEANGGGLESGVVPCAECVGQHCGAELVGCVTSSGCVTALECAAQKCVAGGMPDLGCIAGCANGDAAVLGQLVGVLGCIVTSCGPQCAGALAGADQ